jgi:hypothetical protein
MDGNSAGPKSDDNRALTTAADGHADPRVGLPMIVEVEHIERQTSPEGDITFTVTGMTSVNYAAPGKSYPSKFQLVALTVLLGLD